MGWLDKIVLGSSGALDAYENARETKKKDPDKKKYSDKGKIIFTGDPKKDREIDKILKSCKYFIQQSPSNE